MGLKSSRSEDELFSDAVTEFSDNAVSPLLEERLKSVKQLDKNAGGELLHDVGGSNVSKNEKTAGKQFFRFTFFPNTVWYLFDLMISFRRILSIPCSLVTHRKKE
jgi:hypothetical protein